MKYTFEESGKSIDEALKKAEEKSGLSRDRFRYEVIEENKGFFSSLLGRHGFRVKGEYEKFDNIGELAENALSSILKHMKLDESLKIDLEESEKSVSLNIQSPRKDLIIGKEGATLDALRYVVNQIALQKSDACDKKRISIDVDGYNEKRSQYIRKITHNMLKRVRSSGRPCTSKPLSPGDRRQVYKIVEKERVLNAKSFGHGYYKRINISLKNAEDSKKT